MKCYSHYRCHTVIQVCTVDECHYDNVCISDDTMCHFDEVCIVDDVMCHYDKMWSVVRCHYDKTCISDDVVYMTKCTLLSDVIMTKCVFPMTERVNMTKCVLTANDVTGGHSPSDDVLLKCRCHACEGVLDDNVPTLS